MSHCRGRLVQLFTALLLLVSSDAAKEGHKVDGARTTELTKATFDQYIKDKKDQNRPCLVMFHVNWCKVCQRTFPKFAGASNLIYEKEVDMDLAHVDCTDDKTLCTQFNVTGYPTIKLFRPQVDEAPRSYRGQRTEEFFLKYAQRMTRPPVAVFENSASFLSAASGETLTSIVGVVPKDGEVPAGLVSVAKRWQDLHIVTHAPALADYLPEKVTPPAGATMAVLSLGIHQWAGVDNSSKVAEPIAAFYSGPLDNAEVLEKWVEKNRFPGVWTLDATNFFFFTHSQRRTAMVAVDPRNVTKELEQKLRTTSSRLAEDFNFGVLDGISWTEELADFNIARKDLPRALVTEQDFEVWIEDIEQLRVEFLEQDLRRLLKGSSDILRQDRSATSRLRFYLREGIRLLLKMRTYATRGPAQALLVCLAAILALFLLGALGWCMMTCCAVLLSDDPDFLQDMKED